MDVMEWADFVFREIRLWFAGTLQPGLRSECHVLSMALVF